MSKNPQSGNESHPPLLTVDQAAAYLNVSRSWTYDHAAELGGSRLHGLFRFPFDELRAYVERRKIAAPPPAVEQPEPTPIRKAARREGINRLTGKPFGALG